MNKRERIIATCVGVAVGLYVLDAWLLSPYFDRLSAAEAAVGQRQDQLAQSTRTLRDLKIAQADWKKISTGRVVAEASDAEGQLLASAKQCADDAGLSINNYKPERGEKERSFDRILLRVGGVGSMEQISRFLFNVQHADVPVKVADLQVNSRKDGTNDLAMSVGLSTIYQTPAAKAGQTAEGAR
jgi:Tfp pilus assembly protein PilO